MVDRTWPAGTVAFLFTDIEGSTALWERDARLMADLLARHDAILRTAVAAERGIAFKQVGDALQAAFHTVPEAIAAAVTAQRALVAEPWPAETTIRVRMAVHAGTAAPRDGDYLAPCLNRLARLLAAGHGGQVLLSASGRGLLGGALPADCRLQPHGAHRLRDLLDPEEIFGVVADDLPADFPPLRTLANRPHNLPVQPTPLIGRERDLEAAATVLADPTTRLLTLTGPGGSGKTRLALQLASDLSDGFDDGVFFVGLTAVADPALVPAVIADAIGVAADAQVPPAQTLAAHMANRRLLLVLDNFEHVTAAAPLLADLLARCPNLRLIVTSRVSLRLRGEREFPVEPLASPTDETVGPAAAERSPAVQLFVDRARAVQPAFALDERNAAAVAAICRRLDGLPLAIELAAARVRVLPPAAMLKRLDKRLPLLTGGPRDAPTHQQTLRETIRWSYDLLPPAEQKLFRRLAVAAGGVTLEAAEAIAGSPSSGEVETDVLDGLQVLVEHNVLRQVERQASIRFTALETIREFGREQLVAVGEEREAHERHLAYFADLAHQAEPALLGGDDAPRWLDLLDDEHDNLRVALDWSLAHDVGAAARIAAALSRFWYARGRHGEGRGWLERALARSQDLPLPVQAQLQFGAGTFAWLHGDLAGAIERQQHSLRLWRAVGDKEEEAWALASLGDAHGDRGDRDAAIAYYEEALGLFRDLGDEPGIASVTNNLGVEYQMRGDLTRAEAAYQEALDLARRHGDDGGIIVGLGNLGDIALARGQPETAAAHFRTSLDLAFAAGDHTTSLQGLVGLARAAAAAGDGARAAQMLAAAAAAADRLGIPFQAAERDGIAAARAAAREAIGDQAFAAAIRAGQNVSFEEAVRIALADATAGGDSLAVGALPVPSPHPSVPA